MKPILSIIIPIKKIERERFLLLMSSIQFLRSKHNVETIIIYSESSPEKLLLDNGFNVSDCIIEYIEPRGIYNAFNHGVNRATGKWIMFFGGDDFLLPSISDLLIELDIKKYDCSAIVCNVVFGNKKIFKPFTSKFGLIFRNWCQQGVLYNKSIFSNLSFDEKYPIQADHKFNIEVSAYPNNNIIYFDKVIAFFNTNGISQSVIDKKFRSDFPTIIKTNFGVLFGLITYFKRELSNILKNKNLNE